MIAIKQSFTQYVSAEDAQPGDIVIDGRLGIGVVATVSVLSDDLMAEHVPVIFDRDNALLPDGQDAEPRQIHFNELGIVRCNAIPVPVTPPTSAARELERAQLTVATSVLEALPALTRAAKLRRPWDRLDAADQSGYREDLRAILSAVDDWTTASDNLLDGLVGKSV